MKMAVVGCGALGLLWGARLTRAKQDVTLVTRTRQQARRLHEEGLHFTTYNGEQLSIPVRAQAAKEVDRVLCDVLLVTVKQNDVPMLLPWIRERVHRHSQVLFWQNGWGHGEVLSELADVCDPHLAVTTEGALRLAENHVSHTGMGETWIGAYPERRETVHPLLRSFLRISNHLRYDPDILNKIWEKLAINCVINPLTALDEVNNGALLDAEYHGITLAILTELVEVAQREGMELQLDALRVKVEQVMRRTARNFSSMLQDIRRGRRTEIDYINGAIVRLGRKWEIPTPVNAHLVQLIHDKEKRVT